MVKTNSAQRVMATLQKLLDSVAIDLDPDVNYKAKLLSGEYRTPNVVKQAMKAEVIQQACGLLIADATAIWKAAGGVSGSQLAGPLPMMKSCHRFKRSRKC